MWGLEAAITFEVADLKQLGDLNANLGFICEFIR